jgi:hypothetical protein
MTMPKTLAILGAAVTVVAGLLLAAPSAHAQTGVFKQPECASNNAKYWNFTFGRCMNVGFLSGENTPPSSNLDTVPPDSHGGIDTRYNYSGLSGDGFWTTKWWWAPTVCTNQIAVNYAVTLDVRLNGSACLRDDATYTETFINMIKANINDNYLCVNFFQLQDPDANSCAGIRRHAVNSAIIMATMMGKKGTSFQDPGNNATQSMINAVTWARDVNNFNTWANLVRSYNAAGLVNWDQPHIEPVGHINSTEINLGRDYIFFSWDQSQYPDALVAFKDKNGNILWSMNRACGNIVGKVGGLPTLNFNYVPSITETNNVSPTSSPLYVQDNPNGSGGSATIPDSNPASGNIYPGLTLEFTIRVVNNGNNPGPEAGLQGRVVYIPAGAALHGFNYWLGKTNGFPEMGGQDINWVFALPANSGGPDVPSLSDKVSKPQFDQVAYSQSDPATKAGATYKLFNYGQDGSRDASPPFMSFKVPAGAQPGDNFCFWAHVGPGTPTIPINNSDYQCFQVRQNISYPYVTTKNSDVHAGGGKCNTAVGTGSITGNVNSPNASGNEYVVSASATGISNFYSNDNNGPNTLKLGANGGYAQVCRPDLLSTASTYTGTRNNFNGNDFDVSNKPAGVYYYTGLPNTVNVHGTIRTKITVVNLNGFITVSSDLTRDTSATYSISALPTVGLIARDGILILPSATTVDAYMFTDGYVQTCWVGGLKSSNSTCDNSLTINGFIMGNSIYLGRLGAPNSNGPTQAETIIMNPEIYLNPPVLFDNTVDKNFLNGLGERAPLF